MKKWPSMACNALTTSSRKKYECRDQLVPAFYRVEALISQHVDDFIANCASLGRLSIVFGSQKSLSRGKRYLPLLCKSLFEFRCCGHWLAKMTATFMQTD